jgi:8-oxo-dGTP pyrophosphatase MutT (NUDIX family)
MRVPLPPPPALSRFAPRLSYGRHWGEPLLEVRQAAVSVLIYPGRQGWSVVMIARPSQASRHAGQVALPGGVVEPGESSRQAMLRELQEEVGVPEQKVHVLRELSPIYVYASGFLMQPWLCRATGPLGFCPDCREVDQVIELPLARLDDEAQWGEHQVRRGGLQFTAPALFWQGRAIWGATAIVLGQLRCLLQQVANEES